MDGTGRQKTPHRELDSNARTASAAKNLSPAPTDFILSVLKEKLHRFLPALFIVALALSRIPGVLPWDFSVVYAFVFCSGVYFSARTRWWLPFATLLVTDIALNGFRYHASWPVFFLNMAPNYAVYAAMIWFGSRLGPKANAWKLIGGSMLSAALFYLVTNTLAWWQIPDYAKTLAGWIQALWSGLPGYPPTWEFFRNALLSTGLFTALFVAAEKLTAAAESPAEKTAGAREPETETEAQPEEAGA